MNAESSAVVAVAGWEAPEEFDDPRFPPAMRKVPAEELCGSLRQLVTAIVSAQASVKAGAYAPEALREIGRIVVEGGALMAIEMRALAPLEKRLEELNRRLARSSPVDAGALRDWIVDYHERHGKAPTIVEASVHFDVTAVDVENCALGMSYVYLPWGLSMPRRTLELDGE